jgi:hypothetical protein
VRKENLTISQHAGCVLWNFLQEKKESDLSLLEKDIRAMRIFFDAMLLEAAEIIALHGASRQRDNGTAYGCCECPLIP